MAPPPCFAYGSNLSAAARRAWAERQGLPEPDLRALGPALLPDRRLAFTRRNQLGGGVLDVVPSPGHVVEGVRFAADDEAYGLLDLKEGATLRPPAYRRLDTIALDPEGRAVKVRSYEVARRERFVAPAPEYLDDVRAGLLAHGLSPDDLERAARGLAPAPLDRLFVYGTLQVGESNHPLLTRATPLRSVEAATAEGTLHDLGHYPAMTLDPAEKPVIGTLITVSDIAAALAALDRLEGFRGFDAPAPLYRRTVVDVELHGERTRAWTYVMDHVPDGAPLVEGGRWTGR